MGAQALEQEEPSLPPQLRWIPPLEEERSPKINSLVNLCASYIAHNLEVAVPSPDDVRLPLELTQTVWNFCAPEDKDKERSPVSTLFTTPELLPLQTLNFSYPDCVVGKKLLNQYIAIHGPSLRSLNISGVSTPVDSSTLEQINTHCRRLKELVLGANGNGIFMPDPAPEGMEYDDKYEKLRQIIPTISGPTGLEKVSIHVFHVPSPCDETKWWSRLLGNYTDTLTHLDLSRCKLGSFSWLSRFQQLRSILLYDVDLRRGFFDYVPTFSKELRMLDISQPSHRLSEWSSFQDPDMLLERLILAFPALRSLDISGTNLAGRGVATGACDIPGLNSRVKNPLSYLGLYGTAHDASNRHHIPAKLIGGDKDELQIITAARAFIDRMEVLEKILNDLFHLFRTEEGKHISECLRLILFAMERHPGEKHIQVSGSASLFYIVKNNQGLENVTNARTKGRIVRAIVGAMERHSSDATMMRNGCLTICHFRIPSDVLSVYQKLVKILLNTLGHPSPAQGNEEFTERIAIYLLNSLACQVEGDHKRLVGQLGAIQKMLGLIQIRLSRGECDDVMEIAWSTMWNVTDETPENCELFLRHDGMNLFLQCLDKFPDQPELLRNMMGLLGNVAEVDNLREQLMTQAFIDVFYRLLDSRQDNIEVSYNAAGVLAHILSDGEKAWMHMNQPTRFEVCERMSRNILTWDLESPRNINYRSFKPILKLLNVDHTMQCRLWAVWALANLTTVYPDKYVRLLVDEDGLESLKPLLLCASEEPLVRLAERAMDNVTRHLSHQGNDDESRTPPLVG